MYSTLYHAAFNRIQTYTIEFCRHDIRHSHASMLIEMGFDALEIAERLGHESVKTTLDTYSHLYPDKDKQLASKLNKLRRPEPPAGETP